jgi:hypothetical protein
MNKPYAHNVVRHTENTTNTLVISIAIGEQYKHEYIRLFQGSHVAYCHKHGYDFLLIDEFIDTSESDKSLVSLQKALVCSIDVAADYDRIVFVDADILINAGTAPSISAEVGTSDAAFFVDEYSQPTRAGRVDIQRKMGWEASAAEYYRLSGLEIETACVLNSGVMVLRPGRHRAPLEDIYARGKASGRNHPRGFHYEQSLIGHAFQQGRLFELLDNRWNAILPLYLMGRNIQSLGDARAFFDTFFQTNYFIHFAARSHPPFMDQILRISESTGHR